MNLIHQYHPNIPVSIREAFIQKVKAIADYLQTNPNWLMQVMYAESRLRAYAKNTQNGRLIAAGLLQWTKGSNVPGAPEVFLSRDHLQQLDWVKEYFKPYRGRLKSYFDVYLATFFPAAIGKADDFVFATAKLPASLIARQNPAVNINKDQKITMAEFRQYVLNSTPESVRSLVFGDWMQQLQDGAKVVKNAIEDHKDDISNAAGGLAGILAFFLAF